MGRRSNYTAKQKAEVILSVLSKQTTIAEACLSGLALWAAPVNRSSRHMGRRSRWAGGQGGHRLLVPAVAGWSRGHLHRAS